MMTLIILQFYMQVIFSYYGDIYKMYALGQTDDTGCLHGTTQDQGKRLFNENIHIKIFKSSLITFAKGYVTKGKGLTFSTLFRYCGSIGNKPNQTFSPIDLCADNVGNILIVDAYESTVHLLDSKWKCLRVIMSREDGLCKITCIAIDTAELQQERNDAWKKSNQARRTKLKVN